MNKNNQFKVLKNYLVTVGALLLLVILFSFTARGFFSVRNMYNILMDIAVVGVLTIAQTYVIITGGIELSQGAVIGLTGTLAAMMILVGIPIPVAILLVLAFGAGIGAVNGILVTRLNVPAFIATLGIQQVVMGAALLSNGGSNIYGLPKSLGSFGSGGINGVIPYIALVMIILAIAFHIILSRTRFGRYTYSVGSNADSARLSGINVKRHLFKTYIIAGFLASVAGVLMLCRLKSGVALAGQGYEISAISAVVIGGGSLAGGEGSVAGAMIGALIMCVLSNGLQLLGASSFWQNVFTGIVLIVAVMVEFLRKKKQG